MLLNLFVSVLVLFGCHVSAFQLHHVVELQQPFLGGRRQSKSLNLRLPNSRLSKSLAVSAVKVEKDETEWKEILSPKAYYVLREDGTESPWSSPLNEVKDIDGTFCCAGCDSPLFLASTKYESGSGWPSFYQPIDQNAVSLKLDFTLGIMRTEVRCKTCNGHLGHVFEDGPQPTGQRYCMNGVAMSFVSDEENPELAAQVAKREKEGLEVRSPLMAVLTGLVVDVTFAALFLVPFFNRGPRVPQELPDIVGFIPLAIGGWYAVSALKKISKLSSAEASEE